MDDSRILFQQFHARFNSALGLYLDYTPGIPIDTTFIRVYIILSTTNSNALLKKQFFELYIV